ncbi:vif protein [Simian immunodeficiency virus]|uniref:Virion infectivity factor n=1 Tax=Simian immunodeficiency virus TaxID=11723 RepID=Q90Q89_SIV|nr:vif protein [Simian immunodeficiency virus]
MEKQWIVIPTWRIDRRQLEKWNSLVKYHKYKEEKHLDKWELFHHFQCSGWWTHSQKIIPFKDGSKIIITALWNLTPEKGWLSQYAITAEYNKGDYYTHIDPVTADRMIHWEYFPCFTAAAVRKVLYGERIVACYSPWGHKGQVGTLQLLALRAYIKFCRNGRKSTRGTTGGRRSGTRTVAGKIIGTSEQRGSITLPPRVPFPSLEHLCRTLA